MSKSHRVKLHPEAVEKLESAYKKKFSEEENVSRTKVVKNTALSRVTVSKIFNGKSTTVDFDTILSLCKALECTDILKELIVEQDWCLIPSDIALSQPPNLPQTKVSFAPSQNTKTSSNESTGLSTQINWHEACRTMVGKGYSWVPNLLGSHLDKSCEVADLYVPQKLIESPENLKVTEDYYRDLGRHFERDKKSTTLDYQELLLEFILQPNNCQSNSIRLALVGNGGEGKTVQLLKMGDWLLKEKRGIPIWISLKLMGQKTLCEYLIENWLPEAAQEWEVAPPEWAEELKQLCKQGKVWLLLDGVDEMGTSDPLGTLALQLDVPLLRNVQVVLTCRSNVWNDSPNALLAKFNSYNILPFSYGYDLGARCGEDDSCQDEVAQFINHHFRHEPKLGEELRQKLEEPRYEHLKNMVKNPLCLALLCHTWTLWQQQGGLPDTKAKLYQGFIEKLYNLHNSKSLKTKTQRDQLNRALGELASWALNQQTSRVLLRLDQIPKTLALTLGDVKEEGSLLNLAVGLSWLTNVGLAAENPDEEVYAFFHPTFQEYFASLVMDNDDFLQLPDPESCNSKPASGEYCIFEPQWEEVFLFWSGRKDVPIEQKRNLFIALLNFIDKFNERVNGYKHRAIFLATIGTSEVSEFRKYTVSNIEGAADENSRSLDNPFSVSLTELILKVSIAYSCGYFNPISQKYDFSYEAISKTAKKALLKSDLLVATTLLVSHYWDYVKSDVGLEWLLLFQTASLLGQIAPEKPQSREVLRHFFLNCPSELYCLNLMLELFLARVNRHKLSWVSEDPEILKKFQLLYQILLKKDEDFSSSSEQVMETLKLDFSQLEEADICSKDQLNGLLLFDSLTCRKIYMEAIDALKKRYSQGAKSVSTLEQFCTEKNPVLVRQVAALILATLFSDNSQTLSTVLKTLIDIIRTSDNLYINSMAANSIKQIPFNPKFQPIFVQILEDCWHNPVPSDDRFRYSAFCCFVSYLSEKLPYSDVQQILYS